MRLDQLVSENFVGKKLMSLEFGANEVGCQDVIFGQTVLHASICFDGEDVRIRMRLEDGSEAYAHDNENVTLV